jgi:hypothetical protein
MSVYLPNIRLITDSAHKACGNSQMRMFIQGVSRLVDITAGGDFLGLCDQRSSYKHVSDFGRLRSYDRLKLGIEGNDY